MRVNHWIGSERGSIVIVPNVLMQSNLARYPRWTWTTTWLTIRATGIELFVAPTHHLMYTCAATFRSFSIWRNGGFILTKTRTTQEASRQYVLYRLASKLPSYWLISSSMRKFFRLHSRPKEYWLRKWIYGKTHMPTNSTICVGLCLLRQRI